MRRFEFVEGTSSKFWEIEIAGTKVTTRWGRIGTDGQAKTATLASAASAQAAADKQIKEKVAKGYVEARKGAAKPATAKPAATPKKAAKAAPAPKRAAGASTFSFSAEQDALYARGWPHLRQLVDGPPPRGGITRLVEAELGAGDPEFPVDVPRDVATGFLRAMMFDRREPEARAKAIADSAPIDDAVLAKILARLCPSMSEIYAFRVLDAAFLLEAFLGTERVATALVERFVVAASSPKLWNQRDNAHDHAYHLAHALGMMRWRLSSARWKAIIEPLRSVKITTLLFSERLALLVDPRRPVPQKTEAMRMTTGYVLLERADAKGLRTWLARRSYWHSPRLFFVAGADLLDASPMDELPRLPAWQQKRVVAEFGTIQHRATVRVMTWLLSARSARKEAADWLCEHADFARPVLAEVAAGSDAKEAGLATAALETLGGDVKVKDKVLTPEQVNKEVQAMKVRVEKELRAAKGDAAKEEAALKSAFAKYCESRAAGGDDMPDAYFTHTLAEIKWKVPAPVVARWLDLAIEVMG